MRKKVFAIILSGNGVYDGAEIHEATMTMLAVSQAGAAYICFAPDIEQMHVVNHLTGEEMNESRNVLVESARIARGNVKPLSELDVSVFDAVLFPGGFGVAKNLCTFAVHGVNCTVNSEVDRIVRETHAAKKPIGALCIAPVLIAKILGNVNVTIGDDANTINALEQIGASHIQTNHGEVAVDDENRIYTTPCYMLDATIEQIYNGAVGVVNRIMKAL